MSKSNYAQASLEYLLIIGVAVLVAAIIIGVVITSIDSGKDVVQNNDDDAKDLFNKFDDLAGELELKTVGLDKVEFSINDNYAVDVNNNSDNQIVIVKVVSENNSYNDLNIIVDSFDSNTVSISDLNIMSYCGDSSSVLKFIFVLEFNGIQYSIPVEMDCSLFNVCVNNGTTKYYLLSYPLNASIPVSSVFANFGYETKILIVDINGIRDNTCTFTKTLFGWDKNGNCGSGANSYYLSAGDPFWVIIPSCDLDKYSDINKLIENIVYTGTNPITTKTIALDGRSNVFLTTPKCYENYTFGKILEDINITGTVISKFGSNNLWESSATYVSSIFGSTGSPHCEGISCNEKVSNLEAYIIHSNSSNYTSWAPKCENESNVIPITNCTELQNIQSKLDGNYILMNDIDCSSFSNFTPIGTMTNPFNGIFNGQNHAIKNLTVNLPDQNYIGLFGVVHHAKFSSLDYNLSLPNIFDFNLISFNVTGKNDVGSLAGSVASEAYIINVNSTGVINGEKNVGGLIGEHTAHRLKSTSFVGQVSGTGAVGGLVGYSNYGGIRDSSSRGIVSIKDSVVSGSVGGFIGSSSFASVINSFFIGTIYGKGIAGGFIGDSYNSTINNSFVQATVVCNKNCSFVGGFIGLSNLSSLTNTYYRSLIDSNGYSVGGLIGARNYGSVTNSYWDINTSTKTISAGGTGKTTQEMLQQSTFVNWDFSNIWAIDSSKNDGYPYLKNNPPN
ncbi:MAG: hypothetical protein PHQ98_03130 [Candidatus ainarchaeum sp.]|nr:hypothetical protein [Candidatus ainarchaeum sp.]